MRPSDLKSTLRRAILRVPDPPERRHPFDVYLDPEAAPVVDGVKVERLSAREIDRRAGRLTEAQIEGVRVLAQLADQRAARRSSG